MAEKWVMACTALVSVALGVGLCGPPFSCGFPCKGRGAGMTQGPLQLAYRKPSNVPALLGTVWEDLCRQGSCRELDPSLATP